METVDHDSEVPQSASSVAPAVQKRWLWGIASLGVCVVMVLLLFGAPYDYCTDVGDELVTQTICFRDGVEVP